MERPWKVVGWETTVSDKGTKGCRLYLEQPLNAQHEGDGMATDRVWFNPDHVLYPPQVGHEIIVITDERNRNICQRIIVVGGYA